MMQSASVTPSSVVSAICITVINSIYSIRKKRVGIHLVLYPVIFFVPVISLRPVIWTVTILSIFLAGMGNEVG